MKYVVFFQTINEKDTRLFYAREFNDINEAIEYRVQLINAREYRGYELIYTSLREG